MEIIYKSPSELKPFQKNPYKHPDKQLSMLKKSMREFGFTSPILVAQNNMIIAGHARLEAANQLGLTEVPTIFIDFPYEKAVAYVIADNQLAKLAEEDRNLLGELLQEISEIPDFDIESVGFDLEELDSLLNNSSFVGSEEEAEEEAEQAVKDYISLDSQNINIFHALASPALGCIRNFNYLFSYTQGEKNIVSPFPKNSILFLDSGALAGVLKHGPEFVSLENQEKIVKYAEEMGAHWVTMLDIPMIPQVLEPLKKTRGEAYQIHIRNAKAFKEIQTDLRKVYVIQGPEYSDFKKCCLDMKDLINESDVVAIGTLKTRASEVNTIEKITALVKSYFPRNDIHLFGVTSPETVARCVLVGATSCDSASVSFSKRSGNICVLNSKEDGTFSVKSVPLSEYCNMEKSVSQAGYIEFGSTVMGMLNTNLAIQLTLENIKQKELYESN